MNWLDSLAVGMARGVSRRTLLKQIGVGGAAVAVLSVAPRVTHAQDDGEDEICELNDDTFVCPPDVLERIECSKDSADIDLPMPTLSPNCAGATVVCSEQSGSFPRGTTTVECTATDASGDTISCSFDVNVKRRGGCNEKKRRKVK